MASLDSLRETASSPPKLVFDAGRVLDNEGLHPDASSAITTWTGARVDVLNAKPDDIRIADIAHALARQVRYNGHVNHHLSVARHSIWVSEELNGTGHELWGLLHDASETYIGDMVKPLKHHPSMQVFREAEEALDAVIATHFGLPFPMPAEVHEADRHVTVDLEIGEKRRWNHHSRYEHDEVDFLARYKKLVTV